MYYELRIVDESTEGNKQISRHGQAEEIYEIPGVSIHIVMKLAI